MTKDRDGESGMEFLWFAIFLSGRSHFSWSRFLNSLLLIQSSRSVFPSHSLSRTPRFTPGPLYLFIRLLLQRGVFNSHDLLQSFLSSERQARHYHATEKESMKKTMMKYLERESGRRWTGRKRVREGRNRRETTPSLFYWISAQKTSFFRDWKTQKL